MGHHPPSTKRRDFGEVGGWTSLGQRLVRRSPQQPGASWVVPSLGEGVKHVKDRLAHGKSQDEEAGGQALPLAMFCDPGQMSESQWVLSCQLP